MSTTDNERAEGDDGRRGDVCTDSSSQSADLTASMFNFSLRDSAASSSSVADDRRASRRGGRQRGGRSGGVKSDRHASDTSAADADVTPGTWSLQRPRATLVESDANSSSAATADATAATSTSVVSVPAGSVTPLGDDDDPDEFAAAADAARQERGIYERASDGSIVHRRRPQEADRSTSGPEARTPSGACDITDVGFPEYRWRTSLRTGTGRLLVLCVAEKPSIALALATVLSRTSGGHRTREGRATPVHEFVAEFDGAAADFRVTSVAGHVCGTDFEAGFEDWETTDPAALFTANVRKVSERAAVGQHLESESVGTDVLLLWLDCDREGENICFEVMERCVPQMNVPRERWATPHPLPSVKFDRGTSFVPLAAHIPGSVRRVRFSSLAEVDVHRALRVSQLAPPDQLQSRAVDARQEIDLRIGVAFTRFQSRYLLGRYGSSSLLRGAHTLSFGPCQTPTLAFAVERHDEIERFVPETYWHIDVCVRTISDGGGGSDEPSSVALEWERGDRIFDQSVAAMFHRRILASQHARVLSVRVDEQRRARPAPLNTVTLLKVCSRQLGIGPIAAMRAAEHLYIAGIITYPRTETSAYAASFDIADAVRAQIAHEEWGEFARHLLSDGARLRGSRGVDAGDHAPITPVRCMQQGQLRGDEWRVYEYITRHFLASVAEDALSEHTQARFQVAESEFFNAKAIRLVRSGFLDAMPWLHRTDDAPLSLSVGATIPLSSVLLTERRTTPPTHLTESDLIGLMESHGIGTDASIPMHIKAVLDRAYVELGPGRTMRPTLLGRVLVHGYRRIDPDLAAPHLRAAVERELDRIADGTFEYRAVVRHAVDAFARKFAHFMRNIAAMDQLFSVQFGAPDANDTDAAHALTSGASSTTDPRAHDHLSTQCGKCRRWMRLHLSPSPPRLHCSACDAVYVLPAGGVLKKYFARTCPLDGFELLLFTTAARGNEHGISYTLCPYCYTHTPFADDPSVPQPMACHQCRHPACPSSPAAIGITRCPEYRHCGGLLVLDPDGGPNWKIGCNSCNIVIRLAQSAYKVVVSDSLCAQCHSRQLEVNFHRDFNPLRYEQQAVHAQQE